ncbi:hypothetical protein AGLY_004543 [Aphis glycines]|uniref:Uncharacterized protein n=1 Tax=Aphis glycines TaxID=307491 RepID=A0A6G0TYS1_APHGL|nr:hypothetical protein AGLY_004543 [Aphis glycines]
MSFLYTIYQPLRWAFRLKIFENIFENTIPKDSENSTQYHFNVISIHCYNTVTSICCTHLNKQSFLGLNEHSLNVSKSTIPSAVKVAHAFPKFERYNKSKIDLLQNLEKRTWNTNVFKIQIDFSPLSTALTNENNEMELLEDRSLNNKSLIITGRPGANVTWVNFLNYLLISIFMRIYKHLKLLLFCECIRVAFKYRLIGFGPEMYLLSSYRLLIHLHQSVLKATHYRLQQIQPFKQTKQFIKLIKKYDINIFHQFVDVKCPTSGFSKMDTPEYSLLHYKCETINVVIDINMMPQTAKAIYNGKECKCNVSSEQRFNMHYIASIISATDC